MGVKIFLALLCLAGCQGGTLNHRDLAADVELAHTELLAHSALSSNCFFRTNDIKALINGDFVNRVNFIADLFGVLQVDAAIIQKFIADMTQTQTSANNLLQLQMNTFKGYEQRLHTYAENLLSNLTLIAENVVQFTKDTKDTNSIYAAVDSNMTTYINFLSAEVVGILGDASGHVANQVMDTLESIQRIFASARADLAAEKMSFENKAPVVEFALQTVANQV